MPRHEELRKLIASVPPHHDECVLFEKGVNGSGYPALSYENRTHLAQRVVLMMQGEKLESGEVASLLEGCPRTCVNPHHIGIGYEKRRTYKVFPEQREEIRRMYVPYIVTIRDLADEYGVSQSTIRAIVKEKQ